MRSWKKQLLGLEENHRHAMQRKFGNNEALYLLSESKSSLILTSNGEIHGFFVLVFK